MKLGVIISFCYFSKLVLEATCMNRSVEIDWSSSLTPSSLSSLTSLKILSFSLIGAKSAGFSEAISSIAGGLCKNGLKA